MKQYFVSIITFILVYFGQMAAAQAQELIVIGKVDSLYSAILQEQRVLWMYVPESANSTIFSKTKYPVLYLLDGDAHFQTVTGMIQQLSDADQGNATFPEMIVVGIPNTNRGRDLNPSHADDGTEANQGAENFIAFIEKELVPYIESKYPTTPYRTLVGHSLGGAFVMHTLMHHPTLFNNYLSIDPGLPQDKDRFVQRSKGVLEQGSFKGKSLFVALANTMAEGMDTATVSTDTTWVTENMRFKLKLVKALETSDDNGLNFAWQYYPNEDHSSVTIISQYEALRFFFSWYNLDLAKLLRSHPTASAKELVDIVVMHFKEISKHLGYTVHPTEALMNRLGYYFLNTEAYDKSFAFFDLNIQNYPESANVYDSMGDYYVSQSNINKAIACFSKAVEIGGIPVSKEKLEQLRKGEK